MAKPFLTAVAVSTFALTLAACGNQAAGESEGATSAEPLPVIQPAEGQQWSETVTQSPEGGYILGNPDAPIKLIEFASMTCGHCRDFAEASFDELRSTYINSGRVSFELRSYLLNTYDVPATILTQCGPAGGYFSRTEQLFANQNIMFEGLQAAGENAIQAALKQPEDQRFVTLAGQLGLIDFFQSRGIPEAQAKDCLADAQKVETLVQRNQTATQEYQITGTPTFLINGQKVDLATWPAISERLRQMGARDS